MKSLLRQEVLAEERISHLVKDTYRGLSKALRSRMKEHDVMYGHWTYLGILWQTDGITQQQLSDQAGVMAPSTFAALRSMEESGYVTRRKMPGNRKEVRVFLTQKGAALRAVLVPAVEELNDTALAGIPAKDVALVRNTLRAIIDNLARAAEIGPDHRSGHDHAIPINRVRRRL